MTPIPPARLQAALDGLPAAYPGPGGAAAVLQEGEVREMRTWGYADAEAAIPFRPSSLFRICSITKQFTCALALKLCPDPEVLADALAARLPRLAGPRPTIRQLACNQSGLRDYWTVAMMQGSPAEAPFGEREQRALIAGTRSLQFAPGSAYSYANQNFRLIGDLLEDRFQASLGDLLRREIFDPADMPRALLAADTGALPDGGVGYEGSAEQGFRPAVNRILWTGDAGVAASLEDLIAWERRADAARDDPDALYARLAAPQTFADGAPASYGFGLAHAREHGLATTGHGGALRGWRSHRLYAPEARISVVVFFNHLSDARAAALDLLAAALDAPEAAPAADLAPTPLEGRYLDPETGLCARIERAGARLRLRYGHGPELLVPEAGGARSPGVEIAAEPGGLRMRRPHENLDRRLERLGPDGAAPAEGRWRCEEIESDLRVERSGSALYAAFEGPLGRGRRERLEPQGGGVQLMPCRRALDHTPPGDFTLAPDGPDGLRVGCWLARGLRYRRVGA